MAYVGDGMPCAICGEPINDVKNDPVFATTYWEIDHPLFSQLDDAAMHQQCIDSWPHRDAFVAFYNEHCINELRVNRRGSVVRPVDWYLLCVGSRLYPLLRPSIRLMRWFGESTAGFVASLLVPLLIVSAVAFVAFQLSDALWIALLSAVLTWTLFYCWGCRWRIIRRRDWHGS